MRISKEQVEHVALLSRLELKEEEISTFTEQLNSILEYAEMLQELDTDNINPTSHAVPLSNVLRADEVHESLNRDKALQNAPDSDEGFFKVPRIV